MFTLIVIPVTIGEPASGFLSATERKMGSIPVPQLAAAIDGGAKPPHETLSDRELEVLCLITSGKTVKEIGRILLLSPHTVHPYPTRIKEKLTVTFNVDMTRYTLAHHLIN